MVALGTTLGLKEAYFISEIRQASVGIYRHSGVYSEIV
jgi:hypothetical protein